MGNRTLEKEIDILISVKFIEFRLELKLRTFIIGLTNFDEFNKSQTQTRSINIW